MLGVWRVASERCRVSFFPAYKTFHELDLFCRLSAVSWCCFVSSSSCLFSAYPVLCSLELVSGERRAHEKTCVGLLPVGFGPPLDFGACRKKNVVVGGVVQHVVRLVFLCCWWRCGVKAELDR